MIDGSEMVKIKRLSAGTGSDSSVLRQATAVAALFAASSRAKVPESHLLFIEMFERQHL